mmetsp:Transcript_38740/g.72669  ORF Transcript_38740/g.72669 Transcript_38740/m.72669 type:complete len:85 (-) Transcript_38740:128-382(-)
MQLYVQAPSKADRPLISGLPVEPQKGLQDAQAAELELKEKLGAETEMRIEAEQKKDLNDDMFSCMQADLELELLDSMQDDLPEF